MKGILEQSLGSPKCPRQHHRFHFQSPINKKQELRYVDEELNKINEETDEIIWETSPRE
jgi:hypothetical protein